MDDINKISQNQKIQYSNNRFMKHYFLRISTIELLDDDKPYYLTTKSKNNDDKKT